MKDFYWKWRERMLAAGMWPHGWVARGACYSLGLAIGLFILEMFLMLFSPSGAVALGVGLSFYLFDAALLFLLLAFRVAEGQVLWRLRNRLIVTYMFIGVIPVVLLVAMAALPSIFCRTVRELCGHFRTQFAVAKPASNGCRLGQRNCGPGRTAAQADG